MEWEAWEEQEEEEVFHPMLEDLTIIEGLTVLPVEQEERAPLNQHRQRAGQYGMNNHVGGIRFKVVVEVMQVEALRIMHSFKW